MPVSIKGKQYFTVAERLALAYGGKEFQKPVGIKSVLTEVVATQPLLIVRATVTFDDGRSSSGLSEAQLDAPPNSADGTNPVECAETSAVGRALAFIGYHGSDTGLAGAEEMRSALSRRQARGVPDEEAVARGFPPEPPDEDDGAFPAEIERDTARMRERPPVTTQPNGAADDRWGNPPPSDAQQRALYALGKKTGASIPKGLTRQMASDLIGRVVGQLKSA